jgi:hypothetical protein
MKKLLRVDYHCDPNMPDDINHIGLKARLTGQAYKEFDSLDKAEMFWLECGWPITQLCEICTEDWCKAVNDACKHEVDAQPDEIEEFIHNQRDMYELVDESINFEDLE